MTTPTLKPCPSAIGHFEAAARRQKAWIKLYRAAEIYREAVKLLDAECKEPGYRDLGSGAKFEESYLMLENGIDQYSELQRGQS